MADSEAPDPQRATHVVLSYPADLSDWGRSTIEHASFGAYLRKAHETVEVGDRWAEFVGVGCCGSSLEVPLVVESVDGGSRLAPETAIEFTERAACDLDGNWRVQSAAGPRA